MLTHVAIGARERRRLADIPAMCVRWEVVYASLVTALSDRRRTFRATPRLDSGVLPPTFTRFLTVERTLVTSMRSMKRSRAELGKLGPRYSLWTDVSTAIMR